MKLLNTFLTILTFYACGTFAGHGGRNKWGCLSKADAQSIVDRVMVFLMHTDIAAANQTSQGLFAETVVENSDSINSLRGAPFDTLISSTDKQSYIAENLATPGVPSITTLSLTIDCRRLIWQWEFNGIGSGRYRVRGVTFITVDANGQVSQLYVEFNSLAYALNLGFSVTPPSVPPSE